MGQSPQAQLGTHWRRRWLLEIDEKVNSRQHSFPSPRQTQWFVVQIHSKSPMEMGTHWLRLADRHWRSCKISHAVKRKDHFDRSPGFEAQNPVRVANHTKTDIFFSWLFPTWNRAGATAKQEFLSNHGPVPGPPGCICMYILGLYADIFLRTYIGINNYIYIYMYIPIYNYTWWHMYIFEWDQTRARILSVGIPTWLPGRYTSYT